MIIIEKKMFNSINYKCGLLDEYCKAYSEIICFERKSQKNQKSRAGNVLKIK